MNDQDGQGGVRAEPGEGRLKKGWLRLCPDVLSALLVAINGRYEGVVVSEVILRTWGVAWWTHDRDDPEPPEAPPCRIGLAQLAARIGVRRDRIWEAKEALVRRRVLIEDGDGALSLNKHFSQWHDFPGGMQAVGYCLGNATALGDARDAARPSAAPAAAQKPAPRRAPRRTTIPVREPVPAYRDSGTGGGDAYRDSGTGRTGIPVREPHPHPISLNSENSEAAPQPIRGRDADRRVAREGKTPEPAAPAAPAAAPTPPPPPPPTIPSPTLTLLSSKYGPPDGSVKEPAWPGSMGVLDMVTGPHKPTEDEAKEVHSLFWRSFGNVGLCRQFYEKHQLHAAATWKQAVQELFAKGIQVYSIRLVEIRCGEIEVRVPGGDRPRPARQWRPEPTPVPLPPEVVLDDEKRARYAVSAPMPGEGAVGRPPAGARDGKLAAFLKLKRTTPKTD